MVFANAKDIEPDTVATAISSRSSAMRSVAERSLPVAGSGRMAEKLSMPMSMNDSFN
jgi:hypothetical protein